MTEKDKEILEVADRADELVRDFSDGNPNYDEQDCIIFKWALQAYAGILRASINNPDIEVSLDET